MTKLSQQSQGYVCGQASHLGLASASVLASLASGHAATTTPRSDAATRRADEVRDEHAHARPDALGASFAWMQQRVRRNAKLKKIGGASLT